MSERGKSSNTLALLYGSRQNAPASSGYAVLRLSGFCTGFSADDVARLFARNSGVEIDAAFSAPLFTNRIHFPIDCQTGYAPKECFVEFPTFTDALAALDFSAETIIDGRCVICRWSSQIELRDALFPSIRKESADRENTKYASSVLGKRGTTVFLERKDINGMILLCKEAKTRFPGSSIIKPFRAVVSILCKVPWNLAHSLSPIHRDHIFEMFKLSFEAAQCLSQEKDSLLPSSIVEQMVRCALCVPGFTEKQKHAILALTDNMSCPPELAPFVFLDYADPSSMPSTPIATSQFASSASALYVTPVSLAKPVAKFQANYHAKNSFFKSPLSHKKQPGALSSQLNNGASASVKGPRF